MKIQEPEDKRPGLFLSTLIGLKGNGIHVQPSVWIHKEAWSNPDLMRIIASDGKGIDAIVSIKVERVADSVVLESALIVSAALKGNLTGGDDE